MRTFDLYNNEIKERFVKTYDSEATQEHIKYVLQSAAKTEFELEKDMYEFNTQDFDRMFLGFRSKSDIGFATRRSIIEQYVQWCLENGYVKSKVNWVSEMFRGGESQYSKYVNKVAQANKHITNQADLDDIIEFCANAQDALLIKLTTLGLTVIELSNLRIEDCHTISKKIDLRNENDEVIRTLEVDESTIILITDAINQERYEVNNGEPSPTARVKSFPLKVTGYIFRATKRSTEDKIPRQLVSRRMSNIFTLMDLPFLNITNLWWSGVILYAKRLKEELGKDKLEKEDYIAINEYFRYGETGETYWYQTKQKIEDYL